MTTGKLRKGGTQERGRVRRQALLQAARNMLETASLDQLELSDVAANAGIPKSSAYHFYGDIQHLYADLAAVQDEELHQVLSAPLARLENWEAIIGTLVDRSVCYFRENRSAQQLMFGPSTPPEIKRSSRTADLRHGAAFEQQVDRQFELPHVPGRDRIFFRAVEAIDLMFGLSLIENAALVDEMIGEAKVIACAYLGVYIPRVLPSRDS